MRFNFGIDLDYRSISEEVKSFHTLLLPFIFRFFIEMENDDDEAQYEQEDTIAEQNEWNLACGVQEQSQTPVVRVLAHINVHEEDRLWNYRRPCAYAAFTSVTEDCDREFLDEIV